MDHTILHPMNESSMSKNIHIRAEAAQIRIILKLNILLRFVCIIQTGHANCQAQSQLQLQLQLGLS